MYITNKEIIKCLFDDEKIHHIDISTNDFGTYCSAFDCEGNRIKALDNIGITIDNDDFIIMEYDNNDYEVKSVCSIPLMWLIRNSTYPINMVI